MSALRELVWVMSLLLAVPAFGESLAVYFGTTTPKGGESKGIYRAMFDTESGDLGEAVLAAELGSPGFLALHPEGHTLYAVGQLPDGEAGVAAFEVGEAGLTFRGGEPIGDGGGAHVEVHPGGRLLVTAQYGGGSVAAFRVSEDGALEARVQLVEHEGGSGVVEGRQDSPHPHYCGFDPSGKFLLVPDLGMDGVVVYRVDPRAEEPLERHGFAASVPGGGPRHLKFSPDGKLVYLLNELSLSVTTFRWDGEAGTLEQLSTVPALSEEAKAGETFNSASEIRVHPSGRFVYSGNRGHDSVTVYRADPETGVLEVVEVEPIRGAWPRNFGLDPSGRWLVAAGGDSSTAAVFAIDQETGELSYQRGKIIHVPTPICVLFAPVAPAGD
ncbi:lactonase family protein [soil metagenome]